MTPGKTAPFRLMAASLLAIVAIVPSASHAQTQTGRPNPPLVPSSMAGSDLYAFYCASCHGRDAKGDGPVAAVLKSKPRDLTQLAIRNGDVFPRVRVEEILTGRADPPLVAHGSREMPVWGPIFRGLDRDEAVNRIRIANIVDHLASLQVRHARQPSPR